MRVLWVCNVILPRIADEIGKVSGNKEGWLTSLSEGLLKADADLAVAFPVKKEEAYLSGKTADGKLTYYGYYEETLKAETYTPGLVERFLYILQSFRPDVIHIFGTEYVHTYACIQAAQLLSSGRTNGIIHRTIASLQGMMGKYSEVYMADLPEKIQKKKTLRDILKRDTLPLQMEKYQIRSVYEAESLKALEHVSGRTEFDRHAALEINPKLAYHFLNETLRGVFYEGNWDMDKCEKHRIFVSQADYPIKGAHYVLDALPLILEKYPDTRVVFGGNSVVKQDTFKHRLLIGTYGSYLLKQIREKDLSEHVTFTGMLAAEEVKEEMQRSHITLCPSAIENSPNSVGEAMLLGVPTIAADVGGIRDMTEGNLLFYPAGDVQELAKTVCDLFADGEKACALSRAEQEKARITHDPDRNQKRLMEIYGELCEGWL